MSRLTVRAEGDGVKAVHITIMQNGKNLVECVRGTAKTIGEQVRRNEM